MPKILIVEDEKKIAAIVDSYLNRAGYETETIADGSIAVEHVRDTAPDLILLDIMLPGKDGMDICREIRSFSQIPIIMVTARVEEIDRLLGLEFGADDYVCKPFSPRELVARVKANLRRAARTDNQDAQARDCGIEIDNEGYTSKFDGTSLDLTPVEFRMLQAFFEKPGRVWSRDDLLNRMYADYRVVGDRTVDSHITNLRRKLQSVRPSSDCIRSIYGVGYKLAI
ncbi:MAG: response regulator [Hyphomonadaceae bacterium]